MSRRRVTLIGLGNRLRHDDAAGPEVAHRVRAAAPAGIDVLELRDDPIALLDAWNGADLAVVVDTVRTGAPPGTVHRLDLHGRMAVPDRRDRHSSHTLALGDLIELAGALERLPRRMVIIAIEGGELGHGIGLSVPVRAAVEVVVDNLLQEFAGQPATFPGKTADERTEVPPAG
jgi:hydrogenase maturation protease